MASLKPQPKRARINRSKQREPQSDGPSDQGCGDPILDDPCIHAFLSPDQTSALKQARDQCKSLDVDIHDWGRDLHCETVDSESDGNEEIDNIESMDKSTDLGDDNNHAASSSVSTCSPDISVS